jgi:transcription termination factor Rho
MAHPLKSDDDSLSAARAPDAAEKKPRRPRVAAARPRKARVEKPEKAARRSKVEQLEIPSESFDRREPAVRDEPPREREGSSERRAEEPRQTDARPLESAGRPDRADGPDSADRAVRAEAPAASPEQPTVEPRPPAPSGEEASQSQPSAATDKPAHRASQPQPQGKSSGRDWQGEKGQYGGGGGDRGFWKHGKRKRGRHGNWQGAGQGPREQHPPQPPPPSNAPVYGELPNPTRFDDLTALDALAQELSTGQAEPLALNEIYAKNLADLTVFSRELGVPFEGVPNKRQLITEIFRFATAGRRTLRDTGYIDQNDRGSFVVHEHVNYRLYPEDPYLPESLVKRYGLKRGHRIEVVLQPPQEGERCPSVVRIESVMGMPPDDISKTTPFEELIPYYPLQRILLENPEVHTKDVSMRAVDILTPIGFGQRGLIVAPPRTGKTILLQNIANSLSANSPEVKLILLLIDERPEEVTDFRRHTKGEVVSSTFDETPESHVHCAEMVIEICRRRVEQGEHVVVLLDSITRLARAYNALTGSGGKTMSGGLESNALQKPKRFFGSARNIEGGGSLTIIASALVDTGSRMDEIIFEEFKGTGNSELHLDRGLVERRIFPAINIDRSGTRKEELIYHPEELQRIYGLRRAMQGLGPIESMEMLITRLKKTRSNAEFLLALAPK